MPQISIHRKAKRATVLTKRTQFLKKYRNERSYRPLYEKLKNNNSYLAKALSQEKQNCQSLFSQNLALIAEVQELRLACTARDNVISNVLSNAKETLKMLVTMSGYMTNSISICQEFAASNTNLRLSSSSAGRKESNRRLSTKSPAKGVVKPMVSGHTITKPTINLSRVNMQNINNPSRLSDIQEIPTPERSQDINEARSPIAVSIPITQLHRYENGRACRLPERITVPSPRVNKDSEQRLKKRKNRSKRLSGSFSRTKPSRWSGETTRSTEYANQLSSPTVKLNDVSKLLQNAQSINIKTLIDDNKIDDVEMHESSDDEPHDALDRNIVIPETQLSIHLDEVDEVYAKHPHAQTKEKNPRKDWSRSSNVAENSRLSQNNAEAWQDPLEGPSWLLDNVESDGNEQDLDVAGVNNRVSQRSSKVTTTYSDDSSDSEDTEDESPPPPPLPDSTDAEVLNGDSIIADRARNDHSPDGNAMDDTFYGDVFTGPTRDRNFNMIEEEDDGTTNLARFITMRRGNSSVVEETEDFTLMMQRQPMRNLKFDISELRLPVLEGSVINPTVGNDIESEVTTAIQRITNFRIPSMSNQSANESEIEPTTMIKVPLALIDDHDGASTLERGKHSSQKKRKSKSSSPRDNVNHDTENGATVVKKTKQKKVRNRQDPSAAKVVLEKLNESSVKASPDDTIYRGINSDSSDVASNQEGNTGDSNSENCASGRPRRRRAMINFKEPSLHKKLRRNI
ncbi:PREDICTED: uncharacterized protein LOC106744299 [Dinoponera quadriceps]|uniref:Uncharacterized protein LOC106744299 n=1 Tax=Dinoponera quadriceps TaxID=609295 RepID=A0A6P3X988_DINQU|nr:PREDICTED: uncharacterized protein LOC106744299 [Dinoponera quadriceps]XP_014474440.1 PREDICTED: uncharacterized protein LOC106744299 [Dinoponera quadriceps]XP_014474441.1 PREDICTED: uncharacterized protein LOC106744299 [Dinoponera quadriceps]XP_014474442.1 PREDICTED: uncharacterized protein LOC106744299 [Dinoponera quadriceps]XP_014474443.1 PREDICTED: uncharacterized protein LOC106744299 [Dinoponera quadriceps]XP_014474444.1 PREDICTED: uncharacterized protein LOC106744299 [Dinoponera quadr